MRRDAPPVSGQARARANLRRTGVAVSAVVALVVALFLFGVGKDAETASVPLAEPSSVPVSVAIDTRHRGARVPRSFLGLSFELSSLDQIARYGHHGDFVTLLRSLGHGVIRFGGVSADTRVAWTDRVTPRPSWASRVLGVGDLRRLRTLATRSGWRILLTIGLVHYDPRSAAREAKAAKEALGGSLAGLELGNEPNAYAQHGLRPAPWTFSQYGAQVTAYRRAIAKAAPGVPLAGPDVSGSRVFERWGRREAIDLHPALLTGHHYPLGCHDVPAPTIAGLLSPQVRQGEAVSLSRYMSVSRARRIRFRLDETNTVSCGGRAGISDTFASALWAVDYVARTMAAGAAGINLHGDPANCHGYTPVCASTPERLAKGALTAQPEWYGLLLDKALIGDRPVRTILSSPSQANVDVTTLLASDGALHFAVVDDDPPGAEAAVLSLQVGRRFGEARLLPLTASSPAAKSGVELGGRTVRSDGSWREPRRLRGLPNRGGTITLTLSPSSAMLVTVPAARGGHA
jgi:hypothetical protein